jgi:hypothetical protein
MATNMSTKALQIIKYLKGTLNGNQTSKSSKIIPKFASHPPNHVVMSIFF